MSSPSSVAKDVAASRSKLSNRANALLDELRLKLRAEGFFDDAAICDSVVAWSKDAGNDDGTIQDRVKLATFCGAVREAIDIYLLEVETYRETVEVEAAGNDGSITPRASEKLEAAPSGSDQLADALTAASTAAVAAPAEPSASFATLEVVKKLMGSDSPLQFKSLHTQHLLVEIRDMLFDFKESAEPESEWLKAFFEKSVEAEVLIDRLVALIVYNADCCGSHCETLGEYRDLVLQESLNHRPSHRKKPPQPADEKTYGSSASIGQMINQALSKSDAKVLEFFAPVISRLRCAMSDGPTRRQVVVRCVEGLHASKYKIGEKFTLPAIVELQEDASNSAAKENATYFVMVLRNASTLASAAGSKFGAFINAGTTFRIVRPLPTVKINLSKVDVVQLVEDGAATSTVDEQIELHNKTQFLTQQFASRYVDATVSNAGYRGAPDASESSVLEIADTFVRRQQLPYMLLLGTSGVGKSSALAAIQAKLNSEREPTTILHISLPAVGPSIHDEGGLDKFVEDSLGLSTSDLEALQKRTRTFVLLDALDQVAPREDGRSIISSALLGMNKWCASNRVIVTCLTDAVEADGASPSTILTHAVAVASEPRTLVRYVLPLDQEQREKYVTQLWATEIDELVRKEASSRFDKLKARFQLEEEELGHPLMLKLGSELSTRESDEGETRYNMFRRWIFETVESGLGKDNSGDVEPVIEALEEVAVIMASDQKWVVTVKEVKEALSDSLKGKKTTVDQALRAIPFNGESLDRDDALWSFSHGSICEFLVARRLSTRRDSKPKEERLKQRKSIVGLMDLAEQGRRKSLAV